MTNILILVINLNFKCYLLIITIYQFGPVAHISAADMSFGCSPVHAIIENLIKAPSVTMSMA